MSADHAASIIAVQSEIACGGVQCGPGALLRQCWRCLNTQIIVYHILLYGLAIAILFLRPPFLQHCNDGRFERLLNSPCIAIPTDRLVSNYNLVFRMCTQIYFLLLADCNPAGKLNGGTVVEHSRSPIRTERSSVFITYWLEDFFQRNRHNQLIELVKSAGCIWLLTWPAPTHRTM